MPNVVPIGSVAFVDESVASGLFYTVTGVLVPRPELAGVRRALRVMLPPGDRVHHTVDAEASDRAAMSAFVASSGSLQSLVVVRAPIRGGDEESARVRALTELFPRLAAAWADSIVIDSRELPGTRDPRAANRRDEVTFGKLVSAGAVPAGVRLSFEWDHREPLLGLPDHVGWSVRRDLVEGGEARVAALGDRVRVVEARLTLVRSGPENAEGRLARKRTDTDPPATGATTSVGVGKTGSGSLSSGWSVRPERSSGLAAELGVVMARAELVRSRQAHGQALAATSMLDARDRSETATAVRARAGVTGQRMEAARRALEEALTAAGKAPSPPATRSTPRPQAGSSARYVPPADPGPTRGR